MSYNFRFNFFQPNNIRTLLITNMLYGLILPIIEIFVEAYIMRNTGNSSYVAIFQLFMYIGVVSTSILNGALLKIFKANWLYSFVLCFQPLIRIHEQTRTKHEQNTNKHGEYTEKHGGYTVLVRRMNGEKIGGGGLIDLDIPYLYLFFKLRTDILM
jgi:hypothetical protein